MERQLVLLEPEPDWRLDDQTRAIGRAGLAEAREALRSALRRGGASGAADRGDRADRDGQGDRGDRRAA